ncbi:unnamed protein product [Agarophyton chilense]
MMIGTSLLLTPSILLLYQTTVELDPVSIHLARVVGLLLLSSSFVSHRAFSSRDRLDKYVVILSRAMTALLFLSISIYARIHYPEWSDELLYTSCMGSFFWLLPHLFYAVSALPLGRTDSIRVSISLVIDFFLTVAAGFLWFGFPQAMLRMLIRLNLNSVSVTISRFLGALLIGNALSSILAAGLCSVRTKQYLFSVKIITAIGLIVLVVFGHAWGESFITSHILIGSAATVLWGLNSALGYMMIAVIYAGCYEKKRRPLHSFLSSHSVSAGDTSNAALTFSKKTGKFPRRTSFDSIIKQ